MSRAPAIVAQVAGVSVASVLIAWKVWYPLWMYHGWFGPPGILRRLLHADGEQAYAAAMDEMLIIVFFTLLALLLVTRRFFSSRKES